MEQIILNMLLKTLDSFVTTTKSIFVYNNKIFIASIMVGISNVLMLTVMKNVICSNDTKMVIAFGVSAFIGSFLSLNVNNQFSKDDKYTNIITCDTKESVVELVEYLRKHKIKNIVSDSYTLEWNKTLSVIAFADTRNQSKLIDKFLKDNTVKYMRQIID